MNSRTAQGITSKGKHGDALIDVKHAQSFEALSTTAEEARNSENPGVDEPSKEKPTPLRSDAKVWDLYLDLAEREAKDRAALWNTALDSLLIFVSRATKFIYNVKC